MPPISSRSGARAVRVRLAGAHIRGLWRGGLALFPALGLALLLLPAGVGEGTAMPVSARTPAPAPVYSTDFTGFPKWRGMLERFSRQLAAPDGADAALWRAFVDKLRVDDPAAELRAVNHAVNAIPYVTDATNWGRSDFWETPVEFLRYGGDCEDYAVAKYMALQALGIAVDDLRVDVVDDRQLGVTHAVLLVAAGGRSYVLDNLTDKILPPAQTPFYRPVYAINEHGWWNYGPPPAATAAGP
jgi:predicted transglutaminase-like cysteine proteinase